MQSIHSEGNAVDNLRGDSEPVCEADGAADGDADGTGDTDADAEDEADAEKRRQRGGSTPHNAKIRDDTIQYLIIAHEFQEYSKYHHQVHLKWSQWRMGKKL